MSVSLKVGPTERREIQKIFTWLNQRTAVYQCEIYQPHHLAHPLLSIPQLVIHIQNQNSNIYASCFGTTEERALLTGIYKTFEGILIDFLNISGPNGCSAHSSVSGSVLNAKYELIERDAVYCHTLTLVPFLPSKEKIPNKFYSSENLKYHDLKIQIASLITTEGEGRVAVCYTNNFEFLTMGAAVRETGSSALEKALCESLYLMEFCLLYGKKTDAGMNKFFVEKLFTHSSSIKHSRPLMPNITTTPFLLFDTEFEKLGMKFAHASSSHLQNYFYGPVSTEKLNLQRLSNFRQDFDPHRHLILRNPYEVNTELLAQSENIKLFTERMETYAASTI